MFQIRSPQFSDITKFEQLFRDNEYLKVFYSSIPCKLACLTQPCIPHNFRSLPSIHIAVEGNNLLGFVILKCISKPNNSWQIDDVFVIDDMRNKGIGEELVRYAISVYGGYGVEHFLAEVNSQNAPALSIFHQCGFRRCTKVCFYEATIDFKNDEIFETSVLDKDFLIRPQIKSDLPELEKLDFSSIPPELRPILGKSKEYFKEKKGAIVVIDKSRDLIIGWAQIKRVLDDQYFIELLASPGWTHLYKQFLSTIICDYIATSQSTIKLTVKVTDYISELTDILKKLGFLPVETKEILVKTVWQRVKDRSRKTAKVGKPSIAPT